MLDDFPTIRDKWIGVAVNHVRITDFRNHSNVPFFASGPNSILRFAIAKNVHVIQALFATADVILKCSPEN